MSDEPSRDVVYLTDEEWEAFMHNMQNPEPPTQKLLEGARLLRELMAKMKGETDAG